MFFATARWSLREQRLYSAPISSSVHLLSFFSYSSEGAGVIFSHSPHYNQKKIHATTTEVDAFLEENL